MSDLAAHVDTYLALRRRLGFKLEFAGEALPQFGAYLAAAGMSTITVEAAVAWARLPQGATPIYWAHRLSAVRGFAAYLHTIDPRHEVPPKQVLAARQQRQPPFLFTATDITRLLNASAALTPTRRGATYRAFYGLIAVTGMRVSEALGLRCDDVDLTAGVLTVRRTKSGWPRILPLHDTTTDVLRGYIRDRARWWPSAPDAFFLGSSGKPLAYPGVRGRFRALTTELGIGAADVLPRIHDLRHTFAVNTLLRWHRTGADIAAGLPVLSTYLGHVDPTCTYWYLSAIPELMQLAAAKLDDPSWAQS